jgi:hypothetical protein
MRTIQADATAWSLHAIHCAGVVHCGMSHHNMHDTPSKLSSVSVVLFDFAFVSLVISEYGSNLSHRLKSLVSGATLAPKNRQGWKSMIPYSWEYMVEKGIIIKS